MARGDYQYARDDGDFGLALAQRSLHEARRLGEAEWIHRSKLWLASALHGHRRSPEARAILEGCLPWFQVHPELPLRLEFHSMLGHVYAAIGQLGKARFQYERSSELARQTGDALGEAIILSSIAGVLGSAGDAREAIRLAQRSIQMRAQFESSTASSAVCFNNLSLDCTRLGLFSDALRYSDEAERRFTVVAPARLPLLWAARAQCWLRLGQLARATQMLSRIAVLPDRSPLAQAKEQQARFELSGLQNAPEPAALQRALALIDSDGHPAFHLILTIQQAQTLAPPAAMAALGEAAERAIRLEFKGHLLDTHLQRARIAQALDRGLARAHAQQALALAEHADLACGYRAELWLHCAQVLLAAGEHEHAIAVLREGAHWVTATARDQVPPEFVDSFLRRNPVNVQMLALAGRHGVSAPR